MKAITLLLALGLFCQFTHPQEDLTSESVVLKLHEQDSAEAVEHFISQLGQYGLELKSQRISRHLGTIKVFTLQLSHPKGLDWRIKGKGFCSFELRLQLNDEQELAHLSYRFNEKGDFSKPLSLASCVNSAHEFNCKHSVRTSFIEQ